MEVTLAMTLNIVEIPRAIMFVMSLKFQGHCTEEANHRCTSDVPIFIGESMPYQPDNHDGLCDLICVILLVVGDAFNLSAPS